MKRHLRYIPLSGILFFFMSLSFVLPVAGQVKFGNSYINLSKKSVGGTVQPGDTLEIRTNYFFPATYNSGSIYFVRYVDNVPTKTIYISDSLRLITNEGLTYKRWTNAGLDDPGTYVGLPPVGQYNVRINIGTGAAAPASNVPTNTTGAGSVNVGSARPRVGGGHLITTSFKVKVTGAVGDTIILGAGQLYYKKLNGAANPDTIVNAIQYKILISNNDPICADAIGRNFVSEAGGTFDSGTTQNRSYGPTFLIPNYTYRLLSSAVQINDGFYTIVNNLSPWASTFVNAQRQNNCTTPAGGPPPVPLSCNNRMFNGHWDIMGDHTGSSTSAGNTPKAVGTRGGYMLVVNADYATSEAYRQNITGLCPNTSYEFSLWVKNVCPTCGIDSTGTSTFKPGVYPNLTFAIDDLDRYSTGQVDTTGWKKKGFLFKTGPTQTAITISIRNNASGGGGNDWAIDDIALVTCNPNLNLVPSGNSTVCFGNQVDINCTVRSFFNNYVNFRWEKSVNNGATWSTVSSGTGSPVMVSGAYQYVAALPSFLADSSTHLNQYRFIVASTPTNLSNVNCSFIASNILIVLVDNCSWVLNTKIVSINGIVQNNFAQIKWVSNNENGASFEIERSKDKIQYQTIGTVTGKAAAGSGASYQFVDNVPLTGPMYYRIKVIEGTQAQYTKIVLLSNSTLRFNVKSPANPFSTSISFELETPLPGTSVVSLIDNYGRTITQVKRNVQKGSNVLQLTNLGGIGKGVYTLRVELNEQLYNKMMIKAK
ncbi:MAG TPA: T9SS type A sorting domain-containing protein [Flavitalea sp.]|nr:T9SS type A sorting domain-containing protein [Flavitalea sp.]